MAEGPFVFGHFRLDPDQGVLLRAGEPVAVVPKGVELLACLVRRPGRVVTRDELVQLVWPDVVVEEGNLTKLVHILRRELGKEAIETIPKRGYRFTPPVTVLASARSEVLAVLPFESSDPTEASLGEGIAEQALDVLSRIPGVQVLARNSSFRLARASPREIGRRLSATIVVAGGLKGDPGRCEVAVRLLETRSGVQRDAGEFASGLEGISGLPEKIAQWVASRVIPSTAGGDPGDSRRGPADPVDAEAFHLYLQGRYHWNRRPGTPVREALRCFDEAIARSPGFAQAWAGVADANATLGSWEAGVLEPREAESRARSCAARALALDPGLAEAHTTLAYLDLHFAKDGAEAEERFLRALSLNPNYSAAHHWYAHCLVAAGRFEEALARSNIALAIDPMNVLLSVHLAWHHHMARAPELVLRESERVIRMEPAYHWGHYFLAWGQEAIGEPGRAVNSMLRAVECSARDPVMIAGLARAQAAAGQRKEAVQTLARLYEIRAGKELFAYEVALVHLALNDAGSALDWLERAHSERSGWMAYLNVDPRLDPVRREERFQRIASR
jgi:DNA-binding winged helix-turn-helix (wHTH) protein/tetratricopeptide (TPR) repeat protein